MITKVCKWQPLAHQCNSLATLRACPQAEGRKREGDDAHDQRYPQTCEQHLWLPANV
jgi:hypothetical protein